MHMKRKHAFDLSILCLAVLMAFAVPLFAAKTGLCPAPGSDRILASVTSESLSAVSGTDLFLKLSLDNRSSRSHEGDVVVSVSREAQKGDFALGNDFLVARSVAQAGVSLDKGEVRDLSLPWRIPAAVPTGVYTIGAAYQADGILFEGRDASKGPFGGTARVYIQGEVAPSLYFIGSGAGNDQANITLMNPSRATVTAPVIIRQYDGGLAGRLANSEARTVSVGPGSAAEIAYEYPSGAFGLVAETSHRGVPAVYAFSAPGADCFDEDALHIWFATVGALGVAMLLLVHSRKSVTDNQL
jgi:hypothetical protein